MDPTTRRGGDLKAIDGAPLVGRDSEQQRLSKLLTTAFAGSAKKPTAVILCGASGVGKSALLQRAATVARTLDGGVLETVGAEFELDVTYAGLHHLLLPHLDVLSRLGVGQRQVLEVVLGLRSSRRPPTPLHVATALLALLAELEPVLVVIDDLHWIDRASSRVLGLVARRIGAPPATRVAMLGAVRSELDSLLLHGGLPQLDVAPLDDEAALALLLRAADDLVPQVQQALLDVARGNALALLELPGGLDRDLRRGLAPLPPVLGIGDRLAAAFETRLQRLPAATFQLLLLMALDGTGDTVTLQDSSGRADWAHELLPAEADDLVFHDPGYGRIRFRHPLIRAAVVQKATRSQRRLAHAALAQVLAGSPDRQAWHLAESLSGPDAAAADTLERAARLSLEKGDASRAVRVLLRAAEASQSPESRSRRLGLAAYIGADVADGIKDVPRLLREARRSGPRTPAALLPLAVAAAYHLLNGSGDVTTAHHVLIEALKGAAGRVSTKDHDEAVFTAMLICHWSGRADSWAPVDEAVERLGESAPLLLRLTAALYGDPARATEADGMALDHLISGLVGESDPAVVVKTGIAAFYADRLPACRPALRQLVEHAEESGAAGAATSARMILAHDAVCAGDWDAALSYAQTGIETSELLGLGLTVVPGIYAEGLVAAGRGDGAKAHERAGRLLAFAVPRGARMIEFFARRILSLEAAARADHEEAFRQAVAVSPVGTIASHVPVAMTVALDLVEAAIHSGRRAEAEAHAAAVAQAPGFELAPRLRLIADGVAALAAPANEASEHFEAALSPSRHEHGPFEYARVQLAYGEHLRRHRNVRASRAHLDAALESFLRLKAVPWAERARTELRASGRVPASGRQHDRAGTPTALTVQQLEVVKLAAEGMTNHEIGVRLFMSPRTVGAHLYHAFPKLGISKRASLRDALLRLSQDLPPGA